MIASTVTDTGFDVDAYLASLGITQHGRDGVVQLRDTHLCILPAGLRPVAPLYLVLVCFVWVPMSPTAAHGIKCIILC